MFIKTLTLGCNDLVKQARFYEEVLKLKVTQTKDSIEVQAGLTRLKFIQQDKVAAYHYCFLIPSNKIAEAEAWINTALFADENEDIIFDLPSWNAHNIYFYDGDGNLAEFIVHYDLENTTTTPFDESQILQVCEIGIPSNDLQNIIPSLEKLELDLFRGSLDRFAAYGDPQGLFILVNNTVKKTWFPSEIFPQGVAFDAVVDSKDHRYNVNFDGKLLSVEESLT